VSRLFDGVDDIMNYPGVPFTFGTMLAVIKIATATDGSWQSFIEGISGPNSYAFGRKNDGNIFWANGITNLSSVGIQDGDGWAIVAMTKATGTASPTMHKIPIGGSRTSTTLGGTLANSTMTTGGTTSIGGPSDFANMYVAAAAIWNGTVLTTTDLDGIHTAKTTASILALSPTWCVDDSDAFATDLTAGTADRSSITGTADDADDPAGWVYAGAAAATSLLVPSGRANRGLTFY
jgi:hypothetical protein